MKQADYSMRDYDLGVDSKFMEKQLERFFWMIENQTLKLRQQYSAIVYREKKHELTPVFLGVIKVNTFFVRNLYTCLTEAFNRKVIVTEIKPKISNPREWLTIKVEFDPKGEKEPEIIHLQTVRLFHRNNENEFQTPTN